MIAIITGGGLFGLLLLAATQLSLGDFEFSLEPDVPVDTINEWVAFLKTWNPNVFSKPYPYVNLDGQPIMGALATLLVQKGVHTLPNLQPHFPNSDSYVFAGVTALNLLSYAAACVVFYAAMLRLSGSIVLSAVLAVALFLSPQLVAINIIRSDLQILLPLMAVFYCSVAVARCEERYWHAVVLGVSFALLSTIKISGAIYVGFPVLALFASIRHIGKDRALRLVRMLAVAVIVFAACYPALMFRYSYYMTIEELIDLYPKGAEVFFSWQALLPLLPWSYYNYELVLGHGIEYIALYVASVAVLLWFAVVRGNPEALFVVSALIFFSVYSAITLKYQRGGYHLLPLFYAAIGVGIMYVWRSRWPKPLRLAAVSVACLALATSIARSAHFYEARVSQRMDQTAAIDLVMRAPHRWMIEHIPTASRVCIQKHSEWALPRLSDLKASIVYGPFDYPYTDPSAMAGFDPPTLDSLKAACDFVVLENQHAEGFDQQMREWAPERQDRWDRFFADLDTKYPPRLFWNDNPPVLRFRWPEWGWYVDLSEAWKWVRVYDLGNQTPCEAGTCAVGQGDRAHP